MQTKNVNLLQSKAESGGEAVPSTATSSGQSEASTAAASAAPATVASTPSAPESSSATVSSAVTDSPALSRPGTAPPPSSAPPLPPRSSSQLPPRPATSHYGSTAGFLSSSGDAGRLYSPYKPVPLPKPVPPPYRQPPHHQTNGGATPPTHPRLNNIETAAVLMPGSMADTGAIYVTHSAKFPIKREQAAYSNVGQLQSEVVGIGGGGDQDAPDDYGIPTLNEVMRVKQQQQQRPRSVNAILPEAFHQVRAQQAWTEDSKNPPGVDTQEGIQQRLRTLLQQTNPQPTEPAYGVTGGRQGRRVPATIQDEGEPLLVRSRSGPVYPLGIDNQGLDQGDVGYVPSEPHQRAEGARGQVLLERRPQTTATCREQLYGSAGPATYRATAVVSGDYRPAPDDTSSGRPDSSASGDNRTHLRDACSRMYTTRPPGSGSRGVSGNAQGSAIPNHSVNDDENPYWSRLDSSQTDERTSRIGESLRTTTSEAEASNQSSAATGSGVDAMDHHGARPPIAPGPHRYYHLKDMSSGGGNGNNNSSNANRHETQVDMKDAADTDIRQPIYGSAQRASNSTSITVDDPSRDIYGTSRMAARPNTVVGSHQHQQQPRTVYADPRAEAAESAATEAASANNAPLSPSSTSSESGHGTMRTSGGGPSVQSGSLSSGTLATSFESDVYSGGRLPPHSETSRDGGNSGVHQQLTDRRNEHETTSLSVENAPSTVASRSQSHHRSGWSVDTKAGSRARIAGAQMSNGGGSSAAVFDEMEDSMEELARDRFLNFMSRREAGGGANGHETTFSDSFSVTPPLPPLSPPNSPPTNHSSGAGGRLPSKYKMSLSVGNLHKSSGMTPDILETTRDGSMQNLKESNSRLLAKKSAARHKAGGGGGDMRSWALRNKQQSAAGSGAPSGGGLNGGKYVPLHCRLPLHQTKGGSGSPYAAARGKGSQMSLGAGTSFDSHDGDVTSTTTGLDMESLLDDVSTDDASSRTSQQEEGSEINGIRRQLESLEGMYSEVMKMLGVKGAHGQLNGQRSLHDLRPSRRKVFGSLTSLTSKGQPGTSGGRSGAVSKDRQSQNDRKRNRDTKGVGRRFQRLESHVVTLARSVAHLSSEMRTQHIMFQELENLRQEVAQLHDQHQAALRGGGRPGQGGAGAQIGARGGGGGAGAALREWENFRCSVPSLTNPGRVKKLTNFFGDEPPLLRLFLKKLGYEKYALQFENEKIGIIELPYLTEERLQKIGIPMGPRMRILQEAQMSFRQEHFNIYIV